MTVKELSKLYWLNQEIELNQKQLAALREEYRQGQSRLWELYQTIDDGVLASPPLSDMPKGSDVGSKTESTVMRVMKLEEALKRKSDAIRDIETLISARQTLCLLERKRLDEYIERIDDPRLRLVFSYRFIEGMRWPEIADSVNLGEDAVKKMCYRYIWEH